MTSSLYKRADVRFVKRIPGGFQCLLCPHCCKLSSDSVKGLCNARFLDENEIVVENYGIIGAAALDPIEKKPLFHFHPGERIFSIGTFGCSFKCPFCQNWLLVERCSEGEYMSADDIVARAVSLQSKGIAYTYNEPLVGYEFVGDCARSSVEKGLFNVLVTNGFINPLPWREILPFIAASNIDLKSSDPHKYKNILYGGYSRVLDNIAIALEMGSHVEVTHLVVTGFNDEIMEFRKLVRDLSAINPDTPLHISRYFPMKEWREPSTKNETLLNFYNEAREKMNYVYLGNISMNVGADTVCKNCGKVIISRRGFDILDICIDKSGLCNYCSSYNYIRL